MDRFVLKKKISCQIIRPDRADLTRSRLRAGNSRVSERAPQGTACISPRGRRGSQVRRTREAWKMVPSAARVACIARAACTHESRTTTAQRNFSEQSGSMGRVQGLDNIYGIYIFKKRVRVGGIVGVHKKKIYLVLQRERGLNRNMTCI